MQRRVAYILKAYGRTSETFITNEIYLLEQLGVNLRIFSLKSLDGQKRHAVLDRISAPVTQLPQSDEFAGLSFARWLWRNAPRFAAAHCEVLRQRPAAYFGALREALGMSWRYRAGWMAWPRKVFVKEFLQAGEIACELLRDPETAHIHAHFCHGATTVAMLASRLSGLPYSFTAHAKDIYLEELNPGDLLQRKMARAEFVVTCTGANKTHLDARLPAGTAPVRAIYHGLDTSLFAPGRGPRAGQRPRILSVGRFVEKKGFTYLVEACAILRDRGVDFECVMVGGADAYLDRVRERIRELRLEGTVEIRNAVTQQQLKEIYDESTLFALPCQVLDNGDRDGIPNVLAEAMAMKLPVVSTNISGIPEIVQSGVNGILVPPKDATALADAMARVLGDTGLQRRLGEQARATILNVFDSRRNTLDLAELFWQRVGEPARREAVAC